MSIYKISFRIAFNITADQILDSVEESCPNGLPDLGKLLGKGMQGEVYDLGDRVLKIQVVNDEGIADDKIAELRDLMKLDSDVYPEIFEVDKLCSVIEPRPNMPEGFAYYYVMEKLKEADGADEIAKIIRSKVNNRPITKFIDSPYFDAALELHEKMEDSGTLHIDVNPGAIMQTKDGTLKLVDLDSVIVTGN